MAPRAARAVRALGVLLLVVGAAGAQAGQPAPLALETTIPLAHVAGRIDHLTVDLARQHLFVAELGNGTVDEVDLASRRATARIAGLAEPQGIAYVPAADRIAVASGGDGALHLFDASDLAPAGRIELGEDADNLRVDPRDGHVIVGHGRGALTVVDALRATRLATIGLPAHPEGFQLDPASRRVFVNLPDARQIAVVDLASSRQTGAWTVPDARENFPLAIDSSGTHVAAVFRGSAELVLLEAASGAVIARMATCHDADDAFFDAKRGRIYVSCGEGAVDVFRDEGARSRLLARVATVPGGRTSLFVPELDRLFVAVRPRRGSSEASLLVLRPAP